jgi:hypothetical protein
MRSRLQVLPGVLVALFLLSSLVVTPEEALATHCGTKEQIFWADEPGTAWRTNARGTQNDIKFSNRVVAPDCSGTLAWSTAHLTLNGRWGHWVEVGWRLTREVPHPAPLVKRWFSEWGRDFTKRGGTRGHFPCEGVNNQYDSWKVSKHTGSTTWSLFVNCLNGGGWQTLDTFYSIGFSRGTPTGETGRRGGVGTRMDDTHRNLVWKDSNNVWHDWVDPSCRDDRASDWQGVYDSATQYHTVIGAQNC